MKKHFLLFISLFGITNLLLKAKAEAKIATTYYSFPSGACYELSGDSSWSSSNVCQSTDIKTYEIDGALDSFCLYQVKGNENLNEITKKLNFLRPVSEVKLSLTHSGSLMTNKFIRPGAKLLFYKGDILKANNKNLCRKPTKVDMKNSFYALSYPATFYVMKPFLKLNQTNDSIDLFKDSLSESNYDFIKNNKLNFSLGGFYEDFKGRQISNGSTAKIVNELSPVFSAEYIYDLSQRINLVFNLSAELHLFDKNAGQLSILSENVLSGSFFIKSYFKLFSRLEFLFQLGVNEDLYYIRRSASNIDFKKDLVPRFGIGFKLFLIKNSFFGLGLEPIGFYDLKGSEFKEGVGFDVPIFASFQNDGFNIIVKIGYNNREKELVDLELDYSRYYGQVILGFDI